MEPTELRARVEQTTNIATVPHIVAKLGAMVNSPSASTVDIAEEVGKDQVLSAKVLKLVNSGFCGFRKPIATIRHALVLLGLDVVRTLVLSASIIDVFAEMTRSLEGLWEHSLGTARASHGIAAHLQMPNPEELAVAGLLHDIGKLIIAECFPEQTIDIRRVVAERDCLQIEAERDVLGVTHQEVGMWLLKKWQIPAQLVYPVAYHNNFHPRRDFADRTAVVHLADILCRAKGIGYPGDRRIPSIHPEAWALLDLSMRDVDRICLQLDADMESEGI
ncbi:MAG TPA: HDOD domain-containing protein [Vicinamibacterales bacterium]|nr:HDOD domain-containing protein [Vicinamibacterales bacterium]